MHPPSPRLPSTLQRRPPPGSLEARTPPRSGRVCARNVPVPARTRPPATGKRFQQKPHCSNPGPARGAHRTGLSLGITRIWDTPVSSEICGRDLAPAPNPTLAAGRPRPRPPGGRPRLARARGRSRPRGGTRPRCPVSPKGSGDRGVLTGDGAPEPSGPATVTSGGGTDRKSVV